MAKLVGLGIENFRVFKAYTEFDFAPITLLTGANNSGKSSLIKALLLLAVNAKSNKNLLQGLDFTGDLNEIHNLGSFDLALNNVNSEKKEMKFMFLYEYETGIFKLILSYVQENGENKLKSFKVQKRSEKQDFYDIISLLSNKDSASYSSFIGVAYFLQEKFRPQLTKNDYFNQDDQDARNLIFVDKEIQEKIKEINPEHSQVFLKELNNVIIYWLSLPFGYIEKAKLDLSGIYRQDHIEKLMTNSYVGYIKLEKIKNLMSHNEYKSYFDFLNTMPVKQILSKEYRDYLPEISRVVSELINELIENIDFEFETAVRANSKRLYTIVSQGTSFNQLLVNFNKMKFAEKSKEKDFINKWIKSFEIADNVKFLWEESYGTKIKLFRNGKELDLADLGFGVTQLLPLLMRIVMCKTNYLILEEPENSLHPNLQSKLADMLIDAYRTFGINFIVETHSEYLIRKLQYLVAKQEKGLEIKSEDVVIYYFKNPDTLQVNENQFNKITIDENGLIDDGFGTGFIDEADNLAIYLHNLKFKIK